MAKLYDPNRIWNVNETTGGEAVPITSDGQLIAALKAIRDVACGEDQVSDDDTEALAWIYQRAQKALSGEL